MKTKLCMQHDGKNGRDAREEYLRGRCKPCYNSIMRSIRQKHMTPQQAVDEGWLLPLKPPGAKRKTK